MIRKMVKGIVLIVSLSLVCPLPSSALKSQLPRHKSQVSPASHKTGQQEHHHHQSAVPSASAAAASSFQHNDAEGGQHQQLGSGVKEPALVRLKRIKRQVTSLRTIQPSSISGSSSSSNSKYVVDHLARNPEKMEMRPIGLMDGRTPATTPLGSFHDFGEGGGGRVHTEMLRRLEEADRKLSQHGGRGGGGAGGAGGAGGGKGRSGGKGFSSKTNEIADLRGKGHHNIQDGGRHRLTGTGIGTESYAHHMHEQDKLDSTAAVVAAVRQRNNRKSKHQKNRSDFAVKGTKVMRNYALAPRLRPGDRIQDSEVAMVSGRGRGRGHADEKGHLTAEAKHRTRRGQRSGMVSTSARNAGSHAEGVKTELERIRRMQRDLMKEISHLEHMKEKKKKKRRNVSDRISQGQRKVAAPKRK